MNESVSHSRNHEPRRARLDNQITSRTFARPVAASPTRWSRLLAESEASKSDAQSWNFSEFPAHSARAPEPSFGSGVFILTKYDPLTFANEAVR